jgi:hypothetical protein
MLQRRVHTESSMVSGWPFERGATTYSIQYPYSTSYRTCQVALFHKESNNGKLTNRFFQDVILALT